MAETNKIILGPLIGGLSDSHVNLWGRAAKPGKLYAWIGKKENLGDAEIKATSHNLIEKNGYAGVAPVDDLRPETKYYYALTLSPAHPAKADGFFTTFPRPGKRTAFRFIFGSCFRPASPNGGQIFNAIHHGLPNDNSRFALLIGDQIYADSAGYNGLQNRIATSLEDYREVYRYTWSRQPFQDLFKVLPVFMILDDHEVDDDWRWNSLERMHTTIPFWDTIIRWFRGRSREECLLSDKRVRFALQAYWEHQAMHAPPMTMPLKVGDEGLYIMDRHEPGSLAYTFTYGAAAFFVMDTRTMRVKKPPYLRIMLGDGQWAVLKEWLLSVKDEYPLKFLVSSSSILFSMWTDFPRDRWSGFPGERDTLLRFIGDNRIEGVHILAGDLHSAHAVSAMVGRKNEVRLWEFCSTPLEQKTNRLAPVMYFPILSRTIHEQRVHCIVTKCNYGCVDVSYSTAGRPRVRFDLRGADGESLLKDHQPIIAKEK